MARKKRTLSEVLDDDTMTDYEKYKWYTTKSDEWKEIKKIILERDNYHCMCCGRDEADTISGNPVHLAIHHNSYQELFTEMNDLTTLTTLCLLCHFNIHKIKGNIHRFKLNIDI